MFYFAIKEHRAVDTLKIVKMCSDRAEAKATKKFVTIYYPISNASPPNQKTKTRDYS